MSKLIAMSWRLTGFAIIQKILDVVQIYDNDRESSRFKLIPRNREFSKRIGNELTLVSISTEWNLLPRLGGAGFGSNGRFAESVRETFWRRGGAIC